MPIDESISITPDASGLLLMLLEQPDPCLTGSSFDTLAGAAELRDAGLLITAGHELVAVDRDGDGDEPVEVMPSDEGPGFGRFSKIEGWVGVDDALLMRWRVNLPRLAEMLTGKPANTVVDDLLWSLGSVRVPNRTSLVDIWFGRRLAAAWSTIRAAVTQNPSPSLRVLLTSSETNVPDLPPKTELVALAAVLRQGSLAIDPSAISAHLDGRPISSGNTRVRVYDEGREVWLDDERFLFPKGTQQRRVILNLKRALDAGRQRVPSAEVLEELDLGSRRVRDIFKDHPAWGRLLDEKGGLIGFCLDR